MKLKKWSLWACGIIAALCFGGVCATAVEQPTSITANAAAKTFTIDSFAGVDQKNCTSSVIYPYPEKKPTVNSWDYAFTLKAGSGAGLCLNGEPLLNYVLKQPGDFYIDLGTTANNGDIFTINGTFYNAAADAEITFNQCALQYNNGAWTTWTGTYTETLSINTSSTSKKINFNNNFSLKSVVKGAGFAINGVSTSFTANKNSISFAEVTKGDVISFAGVFNNNNNTQVIVARSTENYFQWDGSTWNSLKDCDFVVDNAAITSNGAKGFYIELGRPAGISGWPATTLTSGEGLKLNGKTISNPLKIADGSKAYLDVESANVQTGDVVSISGVYSYGDTSIAFAPMQAFMFDGESWTLLQGHTYNLNKVTYKSAGDTANSLYLNSSVALPVNSWSYAFTAELGASVSLNGVSVAFDLKSPDSSLYLQLNNVEIKTNDIVCIRGSFYNADSKVRYVIQPSYFKWNGTAWEDTDPFYTLTVSEVNVDQANDGDFWLSFGAGVGFISWDHTYTLSNGEGISYNNKKPSGSQKVAIKPQGEKVYVDVVEIAATKGDLIMIDGTFTCSNGIATSELIFTETLVLKYDGANWAVSTESLHKIGRLTVHGNSLSGGAAVSNTNIYTNPENGDLFFKDWSKEFVFESGDGIKVNGKEVDPSSFVMKSTGDGLWVGHFENVNYGDILTISGTFVSEKLHARYVIEESKFRWLGNTWEDYNDYYTRNVGMVHIASGTDTSAMYLSADTSFDRPGGWDRTWTFLEGSGNGATLQDVAKNNEIKLPGTDLFVKLNATANVGDVFTIGGTFYNSELKVQYVITETQFLWNGTKWATYYGNSTEDTYFDVVTISDLGLGVEKQFKDTENQSGLSYAKSEANTTGSVKFRFGYNSENTAAGEFAVRLRGDAWSGIHFVIREGFIRDVNGDWLQANLNNNQDYLIELGAINTSNNKVWVYIQIDGVLMTSKLFDATSYNTNHVSIFAGDVAKTTLTDPDHVAVTYQYTDSSFTQYVDKNTEYQLPADNTSSATFIGWVYNNTLYPAGATVAVADGNVTIAALVVDFRMKDGASIRLTNTADESGIRFTSMINTNDLNTLLSLATSLEYGTLIMPNDYLADGQAPNLEDFVVGTTILKIVHTEYVDEIDSDTVYYGAMKKLYTKNYGRDFAGRGYITVTYADGSTKTIYTQFGEKNVRSVRFVAQALTNDIEEYEKLSNTKKDVVKAFAESPVYTPKTVNAVASSVSLEENYAAAYVYGNKEHQA